MAVGALAALLTGCGGSDQTGAASGPGGAGGTPATAGGGGAPGSAQPAAPVDPPGEPLPVGEFVAVTIQVVAPAAGVDETLKMTAEDVLNPSGGSFRIASCGPYNALGGFLAGAYSVAFVDTGAPGALARFELVPSEEVTAPGSYPTIGSLQGTDGRTVPLTGEVTIDSGLMSGSFALTDAAGNSVTGAFTCEAR